jgi:hypothetical protein
MFSAQTATSWLSRSEGIYQKARKRAVNGSLIRKETIIMVELEVLEARIRALENIEAIKKLKAKYWRCLDRKLWDEMNDCFAEDAVAQYRPDTKLEGRKAIVEFLRQELWQNTVFSTHRGHNPEIEMTGDETAKGTWALWDYIVRPNTEFGGWSYYEDEYVKEKDGWRIKSLMLIRIFTESSTRETPGSS